MNLSNFMKNLMNWGRPSTQDAVAIPVGRLYVRVENPNGKIVRVVRSCNLRTNAGRDWQAAQMSGTPGAAAKYIALTSNSTPPSAADTTLTGELTTNGFARALATYSHTAGARAFSLSASWTAGATRTISKVGLLTASSSGTLGFESAIPSVTVAIGQILTIFWTIDLGA